MSRGTRLEVYLDRERKWRWRLVSNGNKMADSGQGYQNRVDCISGAHVVLSASLDGYVTKVLPRHPSDPLDPTVEVTGYHEDEDG